MPYDDICVNGVTLENPNEDFHEFMRENGFGSPFGEVLGRSPALISCDDVDKVKLNSLLCTAAAKQETTNWWITNSDSNNNNFYDLHLVSTYPTPDEFKDLMKQKIQLSIGGSVSENELQDIVDEMYDNHVDYEELYHNYAGNNFGSQLRCEGHEDLDENSAEIITNEDYACFEKEEEAHLTLSYHSEFPDSHDQLFGKLPKLVKDQNSYGFSVTGEIGETSKNFPIYLQNHEDISIPLAKDCHQVIITILSENIAGLQLPSIVGKGPLPEDCKKTNECVVHWCGGKTSFSLKAESNDQITFSLPERFSITNEDGVSQSNQDYCLSKRPPTGSNCEQSITWNFEPEPPVPSSATSRTSIALTNIADTSIINHCFQFPFIWNFEDYLETRNVEPLSDVSHYFTSGFVPPANIQASASLKILDIAHDVGGALAIYEKHTSNAVGHGIFYEAQVCNPELNMDDSTHMIMYQKLGDLIVKPYIAAISDSGTFVVIAEQGWGDDSLFLHEFDMVTNSWSRVPTPEGQTFDRIQSIALSPHGHFIAVLMRDRRPILFKREPRNNIHEVYEMNWEIDASNEYDEISIHASESGVISLQVRNSNNNNEKLTTEVSINFVLFLFEVPLKQTHST